MSAWFPALDAHPVLQIALLTTAALFFVAELGVLIFLVRRRRVTPGQNRAEIVWTLVPGIVLVLLVLLIR